MIELVGKPIRFENSIRALQKSEEAIGEKIMWACYASMVSSKPYRDVKEVKIKQENVKQATKNKLVSI